MDDKICYRSSLVIQFIKFLVLGLFWAFFLRLPYKIIFYFVNFYIPYSLEIPICAIIGMVISLLLVILRHTVIRIEDNVLKVKHGFKWKTHSMLNHISIDEKNVRISFFSFEKRWLIIKSPESDLHNKYRLYTFTAGTVEKLLNQLRVYKVKKISDSVKEKINEISWENDEYYKCRLDKEHIIKKEFYNMRINVAIFTVVAIIGSLYVYFHREVDLDFKISLVVVLSFIYLLYILVGIIKIKMNIRKGFSEISFKGDHLMIDDDHYMISDIDKIIVTQENIKSRSLSPLYRYIIIKCYGETHKYWVGSDESVSQEDYSNIIRIIRTAFIKFPEKFKYKTKRSFMNK